MSAEELQQGIRDRFAQLDPNAELLADLSRELGLGAASSAGELADAAVASFKDPVLLHLLVERFPDDGGLQELLNSWQRDADLQEDWTERAGARDLQTVKAFYVLLEKRLKAEAEEGKGETAKKLKRAQRMLRKVSRELALHPDNVRGEFEIYGDVRADELLGSGAITNVYRGTHLMTRETLVVKVLKTEFERSAQLVDLLIAASDKASHFDHPQVARIFQPAVRSERPRAKTFFVMEWSPGGTLEDRVLDADFGSLERQRAAVQLCQALIYAHRRRDIHGDVRPSNLLLGPDGSAKLADFLANQEHLSTREWTELIKKVGTPYYLAPELTSGQPATARTDIFALGRLLFRLFTQRDENIYDVMMPDTFRQQLEASLADFPDLVEAILGATALQPEERLESVNQMLGELHRMGGKLGVDPTPELAALRAAGAWDELIEGLSANLAGADPDQRRALLEDIASIQEYVLGDAQAALETWAQAFRTQPAGDGAYLEAQMERLATDLDTQVAARTVAEAIVNLLDWGDIDDDAEALRLNLKAAHLFHQQVGEAASAIPRYLGALAIDRRNVAAFEALDALYQDQEDWRGLVALLERWLETVEDDAEQIGVLARIALLQEQLLNEPEAATSTYARIRALDPSHRAAFENLDRLHRDLGQWQALADLLAEEIARCEEDDPRRLDLMYGLGQVLESRLGQPAEAIQLYRQILGAAPDHENAIAALEALMAADVEALPAAEILEPIYRRREAWLPLATALEVLVTDIPPSDEKWVATLKEIAEIRERQEGSPEAAFDAFARLHRERPELVWVWDELERLAPLCAEARWSELVALYRATIDRQQTAGEYDPEFVVSLWLQIGRLQYQNLADPDEAIAAYGAVLDIWPQHPDALSHLEQLYQETERWDELVGILQVERQVHSEAGQTAEALAILHRIANLWEVNLLEPTKAIESYREALAIEPDDASAVEELERLGQKPEHVVTVCDILDPYYTERESWEALCALLERRLQLDADLSAEARADTLIRLAQLAEQRLGSQRQAFEFYLRAVAAHSDRDESHLELERVTAAIGEWQRLVDFYDRLLATDDIAVVASPERLQSILLKMASWYRDQLGQLDNAERRFRQVLEISPEHGEALDALDALYSQRGQHEALYGVLARKADLAVDAAEQKAILFRMARLCDEELNDFDRAIDAYSRIIASDDQDREALDGLASIYQRQGDHAALLQTLRHRAAVEPDRKERIALLTRMGQLARDEIGDRATALETFEQALALEPEAPRDILHALSDLYLEAEDLSAWFELLPRCLDVADGDEEWVDLHLLAADLAHHDQAPESAEADSHFEAILAVSPYHPKVLPALERTYTERAEWSKLQDIYRRQFIGIHLKAADLARSRLKQPDEAIAHLTAARELDPDQIEIIDRLRDVYEEVGDWDQVIAMVDLKLNLLGDDPPEQARLVRQLAGALEKQGKRAQAIERCLRALEIAPGDTHSLVQLSRLSVYEDRFDELVPDAVEHVRANAAGEGVEPALAAIDEVKKALQAMKRNRTKSASKALSRTLQIEGLDSQVALDLMSPVFAHREANDTMIKALRGFLDANGQVEPARRSAVLRATAELCEQEGDTEQAFEVVGQLFDEQPTEAAARSELIRLATQLDRVEEAFEAIQRRLSAGIEDANTAVELGLTLADYFENREDPPIERIIDQYRGVLERAPEHPRALAALDRLYRQQENWAALREILQRRIEVAESPRGQVAFRMRLAALLDDHFEEEAAGAAELCIEVLRTPLGESNRDRVAAREMLERLMDRFVQPNNEVFFRITDVLKVEYAQTGERDKLMGLLELQLQLLEGDEMAGRRFELMLELARTAADYGDINAAHAYTVQALRATPSEASLYPEVERLAEQLGDWEGLAALYADLLENPTLTDEGIRLSLCLKLGKWLDEPLRRPEESVAAYRHALEIDPENLEAVLALEQLLAELGQREAVYDILVRRADLSEGDPRREVLVRAAQLADEELGDTERAIACYRRVLKEFGPEPDILNRLEALYTATHQHAPLMPVLAMQLDYMRDAEPESVPAMHLRMGRLAWAELGDVDAAIQHYREALQYPGAVDEAAVALADVLEQTGEWAELVALVRQQLDGIEAEEVRLDLSLRAARAAEIELVDLDAAVELYEEARHVAPGHQGATEALYRLLAGGERWFELQDRLEADMRRAEDSPRKIGLALRLAEMALDPEQLGDIDLAANYLNRVLALDPENLNAAEMLVRLYSEQERWQDAANLLGDMLNRVPDIDTQYDLLLRRGDLLLSHLEDSEGASQDYMAAFRLDESRSEAVDRIIVLFTREEAWADLIAVYEFQMRRLSDPGAKAEIAIKIDKLVREKELPREQLYGVLEEAIAANPPYPLNIQLTLKLVGAYVDAGNLQRAKEYVDYGFQVLKEHPDKRRLTSLWYQKGLIEAGLGNYAEAIQAHQECNRLDSAHLLNLIALSKLLYASQQWEEAVKTLQVAMLKQAELTTQQKIDVYYMVGMASRNMGDLNRARQMFRRVLGIDRNHKPSIKALESL